MIRRIATCGIVVVLIGCSAQPSDTSGVDTSVGLDSSPVPINEQLTACPGSPLVQSMIYANGIVQYTMSVGNTPVTLLYKFGQGNYAVEELAYVGSASQPTLTGLLNASQLVLQSSTGGVLVQESNYLSSTIASSPPSTSSGATGPTALTDGNATEAAFDVIACNVPEAIATAKLAGVSMPGVFLDQPQSAIAGSNGVVAANQDGQPPFAWEDEDGGKPAGTVLQALGYFGGCMKPNASYAAFTWSC
jgi:hypothetical protein